MSDMEAIRKAQAAYQRNWRKKNPEKVKAIQDRFWEKQYKKMMEVQNNDSQNRN